VIANVVDVVGKATKPPRLQIDLDRAAAGFEGLGKNLKRQFYGGAVACRGALEIGRRPGAAPRTVTIDKVQLAQLGEDIERAAPGVAVYQQPAAISVAQGETRGPIRMGYTTHQPLAAHLPTTQVATDALLRYTGVRRSDVVKLGKGMERDGVLHFTVTKGSQRKGKAGPKRLALPILAPLRAVIDAAPSGHLTYLVSTHGKPYTAESFGNKFREWCNQAGLRHCSAHGIRKFDATAAAENGATAHQLMAMFGWDSIKQAEHYTRKASQTKLAGGAMHLLERANQKAN
jgi:hypothetical protein